MAITPIKTGIRPPRIHADMQALHCIRATFGIGGLMPKPTVAIPIGTVPAGAFIRGAAYGVRTIFAPATTVSLGSSDGTLTNLISAGVTSALGYFPSADGSGGLGYFPDERVIYLSLSAIPTAGVGDVIVLFYPYKD